MAAITFYPGDGTETELDVDHIAGYPRDRDGHCAFCHGRTEDWSNPDTPVGQFFANAPWEDTCPCCQGRPS